MHVTRFPRPLAAAVLLGAGGCAGLSGPPTATLMTPGVSRTLAEHRARTLANPEYHLYFDLTGRDSVPGEAVLFFDRAMGAGDLVVDFRGLALDSVEANGAAVEEIDWRDGHIRIPAGRLRAGENRLRFRFVSEMAAAGASIIRYDEDDGDRYLYTLLVPADANLLFPSFDQPDLKGSFVLQTLVPAEWTVLSNAPVSGVNAEGDLALWEFDPTEPISTYLFAFAAGPWQVATSEAADAEGSVGLYTRGSVAELADADTLIATNRRALGWLEDYFEMDYPFPKFDFLLAPAFPFGGMEHPGAIFYNESRFVFREPPTLNDRLGRAATIYHEVAHQWFGDLVTMEWFDDLWLKEGFSTYMAARMQEDLDPGTGAWKTFYLRNKPAAYAVDATSGTTPVWQSLANLDLAKSNYGAIVYNKAPSVLKQLEYVVGSDAFRGGLQRLLREHAYGNITWRDLLAALERSSGRDLGAFGENYILRPGMPVVETELRIADGRVAELALAQRPARALEGDRGGWWPGRVQVRLGYSDREDVVLPVDFSGTATPVKEAIGLPAPDFVFANDEDFGYGEFLLDDRSAAWLTANVGTLADDLLRAMVWGAFRDLVAEERLAPADYVELALRELPAEADEQIAAAVLGRAGYALRRYLAESDPRREALQRRYEALLIARLDEQSLTYGQRKASLDALIANVRMPRGLELVVELLAGDREFEGEVLGQPSRWAAVTTLLALDHPLSDSLYRAEVERDTTDDAERRAFVAGAAVPSAAVKREYFDRYLDDPDLNEEWVTASLGAFNHPDHEELTLPFLRPALERLPWIQENRRIFFLPQWIDSFIGGQNSRAALEVVDRFLTESPELAPDLRRKVLEARDALEERVAIRAAAETVEIDSRSSR